MDIWSSEHERRLDVNEALLVGECPGLKVDQHSRFPLEEHPHCIEVIEGWILKTRIHESQPLTCVVSRLRVQIARRHIRGGFGSDEHGVQFEQAQWSLDGAQEGGYAVPARTLDENDKFFQSGELRQRDKI